jgi:hypothetical protein
MDPIAARKERDALIRRTRARYLDALDREHDAELRLDLAKRDTRRAHHDYCDALGVNRLARILIER